MKLLNRPETETSTVEIGGKMEVPCWKMELLIGIIPIFRRSTKVVDRRPLSFSSRTTVYPVEIDFESNQDPVNSCLLWVDGQLRKRSRIWEIDHEGVVYTFYGLFPFEKLRDNIWLCSVDYWEINK